MDNTILSVKRKNIKLEHFIANILCKKEDLVLNQSKTWVRNDRKEFVLWNFLSHQLLFAVVSFPFQLQITTHMH